MIGCITFDVYGDGLTGVRSIDAIYEWGHLLG